MSQLNSGVCESFKKTGNGGKSIVFGALPLVLGAPSPLNNLEVSWLKSERKGLGKIERSRWYSDGAVVFEA